LKLQPACARPRRHRVCEGSVLLSPGESALDEWIQLIGTDRVLTESIQHYGNTTHEGVSPVDAVLLPETRDEVAAILRIATRTRTPVSVAAGGKNWGLGSRIPHGGSRVVLDLCRMNSIREVNERMATMTVEPGVTFREAAMHLRRAGSRHFLSVTNGPADGSVIGNALERGDAVGPYGDRASHVADLEVVLADGRVLHTGMSRFPVCQAKSIDRHGLGPSLDGLFFQSCMGVVTAMSVWLRPKPARFGHLLFELSKEDYSIVDSLAQLALRGVLEPGCLSLWSPSKVLLQAGVSTQYWRGSAAFYGESDAHLGAVAALVAAGIGEHAILAFTTEAEEPAFLQSAYFGWPSDQSSKAIYAPMGFEPPEVLNPDSDRVGLIWLCAAVPFTGDAFSGMMAAAESVPVPEGITATLRFSMHSARVLRGFFGLHFDRDNPSAESSAVAVARRVRETFEERGFYPFRLGSPLIGKPLENGVTERVLDSIRGVLDPSRILMQDRYGFNR